MKELIGDALRNAAMRFGVALDLWAKDGLESNLDGDPPGMPQQSAEDDGYVPGLRSSILGAVDKLTEAQKADLKAWMAEADLPPVRRMTAEQCDRVLAHLIDLPDSGGGDSGAGPVLDGTTSEPPAPLPPEHEEET